MSNEKRYDVALSFAGEDRTYAEALKTALKRRNVEVFYDSDEKADLWGKNLYTNLSELYQNQARFCIMFISAKYAEKLWTSHEREAIQARVFREKDVYLLPVRLDDTEIPGILGTVGYLSWPPEDADSIADAIVEKLKMPEALLVEASKASYGDKNMKDGKKAQISLRLFQRRIDGLYGNVNKNLSIEYIYGYLSRSVGYLCKKIANDTPTEKDFIRSISWLFSLATKIGCDVQESFMSRYPDCCPHCLEAKCICMKTEKQPREYMAAYAVREALEKKYNTFLNSRKSLDFTSSIRTVTSIYPSNDVVWHYAGPWHHIAKLYEEVSEIHEALSGFIGGRKSLESVSEEITDVLAWLVGAWDIVWPNRSLDDAFVDYYFKGCPVCNQSKNCICKPYSSRAEGLIDADFLTDLKSDLQRLQKEIPIGTIEITELVRSIDAVIEKQNDILMRLTLTQINLQLGLIKEDLPAEDRMTHSLIISMTESIKRLPGKLL